jgi:hypothetical protein
LPKQLIPFAICYDFDGTLAPGNMQERDFIPKIGMKTKTFWEEVKALSKTHQADNILMYMGLMLTKAQAAQVPVKREDFVSYGKKLQLFDGVSDWFRRINDYGKVSGLKITHHIISSGIREMIEGTSVKKYFKDIYASSFQYDHHGVAKWPAMALNYTTKTQFLFRINKGIHDVYDDKVNKYVPPQERPVPFTNMIFVGDGETDVPCFRLVKDQGGHSIAVFKPKQKGAKAKSESLLEDGRVNFIAPADYTEKSKIDVVVKAIMEKVAADQNLVRLTKL